MLKVIAGIWLMAISGFIASANANPPKNIKGSVSVWPPYENITDQERPGFSTEVVREVFKEMQIHVDISEYSWARALRNTYEGKADALFSAFYSDERAEKCFYPTEPLATAKYVLFVRTSDLDTLKFDTLSDLKERRIGLVRDASYPEEFLDFIASNSHVEEVTVEGILLKMLFKGRLDYAVVDHANGIILAKQLGIERDVAPILTRIVKEDEIYLAFSKKTVTPKLVSYFSQTLKRFKQTDKYQRIYAKYYSFEL